MSPLRLDVLTILPEYFDLNADSANAAVLRVRAEWAGVDVHVDTLTAGIHPPSRRPDVLVVGSGAEEDIEAASVELARLGSVLGDWVAEGAAMLAIGTGWSLLSQSVEVPGRRFVDGVGLFTGEARLLPARVSGDLVVDSEHGRLVGYENHSRSYFHGPGEQPLGRVAAGTGNTGGVEGAVRDRLIGTHLHGPVLAKNPVLADRLLQDALGERYQAAFEPGGQQMKRADALAQSARGRILDVLQLSSQGAVHARQGSSH